MEIDRGSPTSRDAEIARAAIVRARSSKQSLLATLSLIAGAVVAVISAIVLSQFGTFQSPAAINAAEPTYVTNGELLKLAQRIDSLEAQVRQPSTGTDARLDAPAEARLGEIDTRLKAFESAIAASPERALSIPLLRRDIDELRTTYKQNQDQFAQQLDRIYGQNQWFIGLMFTVALGLIGVAVPTLIQSRKRAESDD